MARNIEIKARLSSERMEKVRKEALARASAAPEDIFQRDTFYRAANGRLKLREIADGSAELIAYERPDRAGPKISSYARVDCPDPASLHQALACTLGVRGVVEKRRQVIRIGPTRVHLDEVAGLGRFFELEVMLREDQPEAAGEAIARELMAAFGITPDALVEGAYIDLLEAAPPDAHRAAAR
jgi:predicted adenylyl cyclase CyaB